MRRNKGLRLVESIMLLIGVVWSFSCCNAKEEDSISRSSSYPTIRIGGSCYSDQQEDLDAVSEEISKITRDLVGCNVELVWANPYLDSEYVYFNDKKPVDIRILSYDRLQDYVKEGFILPLDDYLEEQAILKINEAVNSTQLTILNDGKVYGIPKAMREIHTSGLILSTSLLNEYKIDADSITSYEELEPALEIIKENEPNVIPYVTNRGGPYAFVKNTWGDLLDQTLAMIYYEDQSLTVVNKYETKEYQEQLALIRRWYENGYLQDDIDTNIETGENQVFSGQAFSAEFVIRPDEVQYAQNFYGEDVTIIAFKQQAYLTSQSDLAYSWCISSETKEPNLAAGVLQLMYTNSEINNLLLYGIEGKHYVVNPEGSIQFPEGVTIQNVGYYNNAKWMFNRRIAKVWQGVPLDINELVDAFYECSVPAASYGFLLDESKISVDLEKIQAVIADYTSRLECGVANYKKELPKFIQELKDNGSEQFLQEVQRQVNDWREK